MKPIVIVNFKAYEQGTGEKAQRLSQICSEFGAWVAVQPTDIRLCAPHATVLGQHVDAEGFGAHTGSVLCEAIKQAGAVGSLINHAEKKMTDEEVGTRVLRLKELGMTSIVCAENLDRAQALKQYNPDYLALELPELIGGDISIITAQPGIVKQAVELLGKNVLLGAGVSSGADLKQALDEGAAGVLLASAIVSKTDDPQSALRELYSKI